MRVIKVDKSIYMKRNNIRKLILDLYKIKAVKFGEFTLKSGIISPIYIDLRLTTSYPKILNTIAEIIWDKIQHLSFDMLCGVPYTAIPFTSIIAVAHNIPMVMCRKELKSHGTKKIVEGYFQAGQTCLIVEDLITSGASILETATSLKESGLIVKDTVVLIDREQNGKKLLAQQNYNLHSVFTLGKMLEILQESANIEMATANKIENFIQQNQF